MQLGDGGAGDVDALGVGARVGRGEVESGVVDEVVGEGDIGGGEAFEDVACAEGEAEPETLGARTGEEGAAGEAFGVEGVVEVEVADVADVLYVLEEEGDNPAGEVEQVEGAFGGFVENEGGEGQVAGESVSGVTAYDDLLVRGGHSLADCRMWSVAGARNLRME